MLESLKSKFVQTFLDVYKALFIPTDQRTPITPIAAVYGSIPFLLVVWMAYLTRRPNTYLLRLTLLPFVTVFVIAWQRNYYLAPPTPNMFNWGLGLITAVIVAKLLQFGLSPAGTLKIGEIAPGIRRAKSPLRNGNGHVTNTGNSTATKSPATHRTTPHSSHKPIVEPKKSYIPRWLNDVFEVSFAMRGYDFEFGKDVHRPVDRRPMEKYAFLRATLYSLVKHFLFVDFAESTLKLFPGIRDSTGGSLFYSQLPFLRRYAVSSGLHLITGQALALGIEGVYEFITLLGVGLCDSDPHEWPPVMDSPFSSDSLHGIWAQNWHQVLRQTFLVFGGWPGYFLGGNAGLVLGTFLASGLYHEVAIQAMGRGWDSWPVVFFAIQGPFLLLERLWRTVTGHRVGGWTGRLWVYFNLLGLGQMLINSWLKRGLGGDVIVPPEISPSRLLLFPLIGAQEIVNRYVLLLSS